MKDSRPRSVVPAAQPSTKPRRRKRILRASEAPPRPRAEEDEPQDEYLENLRIIAAAAKDRMRRDEENDKNECYGCLIIIAIFVVMFIGCGIKTCCS